jgi:hypothetical protein
MCSFHADYHLFTHPNNCFSAVFIEEDGSFGSTLINRRFIVRYATFSLFNTSAESSSKYRAQHPIMTLVDANYYSQNPHGPPSSIS